MLPSGLPVDRHALDTAAPRREPSVGTSSQITSNDWMRGGQAKREGRRLFFTCPKALAIFHAANAMANDDQYTRNSLHPHLRPNPNNTQENLRGQPCKEAESSVTLPGVSVSTLTVCGRADRAALHQDPPAANPHAAFTSTSTAAAASPSVAPPPGAAAMQTQSTTSETATSPTPEAPPPWRLWPVEAVPYPNAAQFAVPAPACQPPRGVPSLSAAQAPPPAVPYPVADPVDSMPPSPEPPPRMPYPTVLPSATPAPAPAPGPVPAMPYAPAPRLMAPPAVSPHTSSDPLHSAPRSPQPRPATLHRTAAPAAAPAPLPHPHPLSPLQPLPVAAAASAAPRAVAALAPSASNCPPPLHVGPHPAARPPTSLLPGALDSLPIGLAEAAEAALSPPLPEDPPQTLPAQLSPVGTQRLGPGPEAHAPAAVAVAPQPQAASRWTASAGAALKSGAAVAAVISPPQQLQQPSPPPQQQQPQKQSDGPAEAAAAAAALEACLKPARSLNPEHKEQRVRAVLAVAMSRAWDDCVRHYQGQGQGQQGARAGPDAAAPGPEAAGVPTRLQLLQFGWTTAQLDSLFASHFPPWPPGRMSYGTVAIMYENLGSGIGSRGLRQKPGGGGADVVVAPVAGWGATRVAVLRRLLQALVPMEQEAQRVRVANQALEEAERARAARREALRRLRESSVDATAAGAQPGPPVPPDPRLREVLTRIRTYLRMTLRPHLTAKDPRPLPLGDFLRGLSKAASVDLDEETKTALGVQNAEQLVANWLHDVAEVRHGEDGSVGLVASVAYRLQPDRSNHGLHVKRAAVPVLAQQQPPPQQQQQQQQQQQPGLVGRNGPGSERSGGGGDDGAGTGQPHGRQPTQRHQQAQAQADVCAGPHCPSLQEGQRAQRKLTRPPHPPPHQPRPPQGASGSLSGDDGSGPLDSAGSWPTLGISPRHPGPPMPPSPHEASGLLPLGSQPSQHTDGGDQVGLRRPSDTVAGSSTTTTFRAAPTAARSAVTASMGPSAGSSGYLSGATCVASSGSGGDGRHSRPLSSGAGDGGSYGRFEGAASASISRRAVELPAHLRPKPAPKRTQAPTQQQPKLHPQPPPQQPPVCADSACLTACTTGNAVTPAGSLPQAAATAAAAGAIGQGGGSRAAPLSREERSVSGMPLVIEQWALAQAEGLGADCLAACGSAGGGSCWQATIVCPQGPTSRWGPTRQAAMQALHAVLRGLCGPSARS